LENSPEHNKIILAAEAKAAQIRLADKRTSMAGEFSTLHQKLERFKASMDKNPRSDTDYKPSWRQSNMPDPSDLLKDSGVPSRYNKASVGASPDIPERESYRAKFKSLRDAVSNAAPIVALLGPRGTGKSWMACAIVLELCRRGSSAKYCDTADFFLEVKRTYGSAGKEDQTQIESKYARVNLLVLDEVQERGETAWEDLMLTRLVNKRYQNEKITILISNQSPQEFISRVGESVADRISDTGGIIVCDWPSLRGRV
jgi:DNA replication protein DnaC